MALWEYGSMSVKDLGSKLYLDSGTLTPLLKKLEDKGYVRRVRSKNDERLVIIELTDEGIALRDEAKKVPESMGSCINMTYDEFVTMKTLLDKIIGSFEE
jgi:DNA-binding MarR family transcriptional regulator